MGEFEVAQLRDVPEEQLSSPFLKQNPRRFPATAATPDASLSGIPEHCGSLGNGLLRCQFHSSQAEKSAKYGSVVRKQFWVRPQISAPVVPSK
jgi:hypothetical protein